MPDNFIVLFTFCDVGKIISKQCFDEKDSAFHEIINIKKELWYFKFNNSGIFSKNKNNISREFFDMGKESFTKLFDKLKSLNKVKLNLSIEVNKKKRN